MKKCFFLAATGLLLTLIACTNANNDNKGNNVTDRYKEGSRAVYTAMETGDVSKLDTFLADQITEHEGGNDRTVSRDSLKAFFASMHNKYKDLKFDVIASAVDGDYGMTLTRMTGTTTDASTGVPANTKIDSKAVDVVRLQNGRAAEHWGFQDARDVMNMMGMMNPNIRKELDKMNSQMNQNMNSRDTGNMNKKDTGTKR
ncbi:MAG: ester cyclase [Chitinophagaceae bacterium]|nr:ester cyclase [Chitinophagaceae bacterium]